MLFGEPTTPLSQSSNSSQELLTQPKIPQEDESSYKSPILSQNSTKSETPNVFSFTSEETLSRNNQDYELKSSQDSNTSSSQKSKLKIFSQKSTKSETITIGSDDEDDIRITNKRSTIQKIEQIPKKMKYENLEKSNTCSICLEPWNCSGIHQICCLECGHLFGKNCIEKWLNQKKNCPKCLQKAFKNQIRLLYHENISTINDEKVLETKRLLQVERELRKESEKNYSKLKKEFTSIKEELLEMKSKIELKSIKNELKNEKFIFKTNIEISNGRVMDFCDDKLFIGCNVGDILIEHLEIKKKETCLRVHSKSIRDLKVKNNLILSSSYESLKISNNKKMNISIDIPNEDIWSCCWNENDENLISCGTHSGKLLIFDIRNTKDKLKQYLSPHIVPLHSLQHVKEYNGYLSSSINGIYFFEELKSPTIISTGNCSFTTFNEGLILSTFRETSNTKSSHKIFTLNRNFECQNLKIIEGFKLKSTLSKSCLFKLPTESLIVASNSEDSKQVILWNYSQSHSSIFQSINCSNIGQILQIKC
eukprot:gene297-6711_t